MLVSLKEAKKYLRVDHDDEDTIIQKFIRAAETLCEGTLRKATGEDALWNTRVLQIPPA